MERLGQGDFITELRRLHGILLEAMQRDDPTAIEQAVDDMALFLRYNATGRLPEYFALRAAVRI